MLTPEWVIAPTVVELAGIVIVTAGTGMPASVISTGTLAGMRSLGVNPEVEVTTEPDLGPWDALAWAAKIWEALVTTGCWWGWGRAEPEVWRSLRGSLPCWMSLMPCWRRLMCPTCK